jgi:putative salt-induced outer membrane protein YdiY
MAGAETGGIAAARSATVAIPGSAASAASAASMQTAGRQGWLLPAAIAAGLGLAAAPQQAAAQLTVKEDGQWRYAAGVGASWASGNSDSKSVNITADAVKATTLDKWTLYGRLLYAEDRERTTSDQLSAGVRYDWNISPTWFHFGMLDWLRDRPANLEYRISINSGLGYHVFKRDDGFWDVFAGIGYAQDDLIERTEVSDAERSRYGRAELLIGQQSEHRISDSATLKQRLTFLPSLEDSDSYRGVFDTTLSVAINRRFDLTASLNYRYNSQPGTGLDKVDVLFVTGFTVKME